MLNNLMLTSIYTIKYSLSSLAYYGVSLETFLLYIYE